MGATVWCLGAQNAFAEPIEASGEATLAEIKDATPERARAQAIQRARARALELALGRLEGPVDAQARKAVLAVPDAWTGAYRVLGVETQGDKVVVRVEVELDLPRLDKRVGTTSMPGTVPLYRLAEVLVAEGCGAVEGQAAGALADLDAVATDGQARPLTLRIRCLSLGTVPNTLVEATTVALELRDGSKEIGTLEEVGFGVDPASAQAEGLQRGLERAAEILRDYRRGRVMVRVESPLPSARIRHVERALVEGVRGVDRASVAGIDRDGSVRLVVEGQIDAETLARRMRALSLPGFSMTIVSTHAPSELTVRLEE